MPENKSYRRTQAGGLEETESTEKVREWSRQNILNEIVAARTRLDLWEGRLRELDSLEGK
ncbi:hypothetical protein LCGC14_0412280 [marine sediment metagenome]|uniref:Uncharacterized protein n=1 Tax=marine sediment metagenome TaxID=412755 RepID=A0A0F9TBG5_9ZZZZ